MKFSDFQVGVDTEEIQRFEKYVSNPKDSFVKRVYTSKEIAYCYKDKQVAAHLAARFCAKEAAYKAFSSLGVKGVQLSDIEVQNHESGAPFINLLSEHLKSYMAKLSLSHSRNVAVASVVVFRLK